MVDLATLLAFWKKKEAQSVSTPERIIPLPNLPAVNVEAPRITSEEEVNRAREALKVLRLERQILGSALTTIYESHSKGIISQPERDRLLEKYRVDVDRLEKAIEENQRIVDLFDLESAREQLTSDFRAKLAEIDEKIRILKSGGALPHNTSSRKSDSSTSGQEGGMSEKRTEPSLLPKEKKVNEDDAQINEAEQRIKQIREEILKAMDRLEQIEAEG